MCCCFNNNWANEQSSKKPRCLKAAYAVHPIDLETKTFPHFEGCPNDKQKVGFIEDYGCFVMGLLTGLAEQTQSLLKDE